ncbi:MAG: beta-L-arabinofuranosidase domain-containing protein [Fimbriimonadaceae bacterium]
MIVAVLALVSAGFAPRLAPPKPKVALQAFTYGDVVLTGGPLAAQADGARDFYLNLNEDSLLQGFRLRAGLPAPGKPMGGWYDPDGFAAAHPFGQYISALSRIYASTGDIRYKQKVARLVHGFHQTIGADGYFYASAKVAREWPCYLYDKNCTGMRDAYTLTGNAEALVVLSKMTDWAYAHLPRRSDEWYTLSENLYKCYELTKEPRYLAMAAEYDYSHDYYDAFAAGFNAFTPTRHAYSHVNTLCSAAAAYAFTGNEKYLRAIRNAWRFLTTTQMYASGGWGPDERFVTAGKGNLAASLKSSQKNFETPCGTYANVNLDRYLLEFTGSAKYGDNMERVLLNGMLAALPPEVDGHSFYYSDYRAGAKKQYFPDAWPCCSGTYSEITADYPVDIYFHDAHGLYVNLFASSRLKWSFAGRGVSVEQKTDYPVSPATTLFVHTRRPAKFAVNIRIPAWVAHAPSFRVNHRQYPVKCRPATFCSITRTWHDGDELDVTFPESLRFEPIDAQTPARAALMFGPLLLVAIADKDVRLVGDPARPDKWIKPDGPGSLDFHTAQGLRFRPFYMITGERYTTYCHVATR